MKTEHIWSVEQSQTEFCGVFEYRLGDGPYIRDAFRPDAVYVLRLQRTPNVEPIRLICAVEIDLSTVSRARFERKCLTAMRVADGGLINRWFGQGLFRYLVVTNTEPRRDYLRGIVRELTAIPDPAILFTTIAETDNFLGSIWQTTAGKSVSLTSLADGEMS